LRTTRTLILGGGYAGLAALRRLRRETGPARHEIVVVDAFPHHTIKTRFHEVAVVRGRDHLVRYPIEWFARASGAVFHLGEVHRIAFRRQSVVTSSGSLDYDSLLITLGGQTTYLGVRGAGKHTVSLLTFEAARECRRRIEALGVEAERGPVRRVLVCGAGIEGVEVAAMLRQVAAPRRCEIRLIEKAETILGRSQCGERQRRYLEAYFRSRAVRLMLGTAVAEVREGGVQLASGERVEADLVVWCSGVRRSEVGGLGKGTPFRVNACLQCPEHPEVFAVGDFARVEPSGEWSNLLSAQRAMYHAGVAAGNLVRRSEGRPMVPERYRPRGELIGLGDRDGVGIVAGLPVEGRAAVLVKKANEARYLAELFRDVPAYLVRSAVPALRRPS